MLTYLFECSEHGRFEVKQPMLDEHKANCPVCGKPAQRIFTPFDTGVRVAVKSSWRGTWI